MKLWTGVITEKVQESKDFYVRLFDCVVIYEADGGWFVLLQLGNSELGFMKPNLKSQAQIFRPTFQGLGIFIAVDVEDVDAEYKRIQALGVPIEVTIRDELWGDRHFAVIDPNGIGVDVVQRNHSEIHTEGDHMNTMEIARKMVELCRQGKDNEALDTLFADNVVSVEPYAWWPGAPQEAKGIAALKGKSEWWLANHEIHSASVTGPWPHGDRFVVGFQYDLTNKPSGKRMKIDEIGLYSVRNEKIVREEFFYDEGM